MSERSAVLVSGLAAELDELAKRLIARAYLTVEKAPPLALPVLSEVAARRLGSEVWSRDPVSALEQVLASAALQLDGRFGAVARREAVFLLYNLDGGTALPGIRKRDLDEIGAGLDAHGQEFRTKYAELRATVLSRAGLEYASESTVKRRLKDVRLALARVLLDERPSADDGPDEDGRDGDGPSALVGTVGGLAPVLGDGFIDRPVYEREIRRVRESGGGWLWLHGDAGTGKSRLARSGNRDLVAEHLVPVLPADDRSRLEQMLAAVLADSGVDPSALNATNLWATVRALRSRGGMPPVLVLDDLPRDSDIPSLIGAGRTLIIVTSRQPPPHGFPGPGIRVAELTAAETAGMLRSRLPAASDADRERLAAALGGRPLAIEHGCAFIRTTGIPVADYCSALAEAPADALTIAADGHDGRALTRVYSLMLQQILEAPDTLRALDLLLAARIAIPVDALAMAWPDRVELPPARPGPGGVDKAFIRSSSLWTSAWPGVRYIQATQRPQLAPMHRMRLHAALRRLEEMGILRADNGLLTMHQLTAAILRDLRAMQDPEAAVSLDATLLRAYRLMLHAENWVGGDALSLKLVWWAPSLREVLARVTADRRRLLTLPTAELVELATVAGGVLCADRQVAHDPQEAFGSAAVLSFAVLVRRDHLTAAGAPEGEIRAVQTAARDVLTSALQHLVLVRQFDHSVDSFPNWGATPTGFQKHLANSARLRYHTEWDPSHRYVDVAGRQQAATDARRRLKTGEFGVAELRASASASVAAGAIHYDLADWDAAVGELEHAYFSYLQVGASVECIRGAMDTARRLACVHLRAGRLDEADQWLRRQRAEVYEPRCEVAFEEEGTPFAFRDVLLEMQLSQVRGEIELTRRLLHCDGPEGPTDDEVESLVKARLPIAQYAVALAVRARAGHLLPELALYERRLLALIGDQNWAEGMDGWFDPDERPYQAMLLQLQIATFAVPALTAVLAAPDEALQMAETPEQHAYVVQVRDARQVAGTQLYWMSRAIMEKHNNPYWYTRGLCAASVLAAAAGRAQWAASIRGELTEMAERIGRPDWIDKADGFGSRNSGLWLMGY